jgi:hypothetical protein
MGWRIPTNISTPSQNMAIDHSLIEKNGVPLLHF